MLGGSTFCVLDTIEFSHDEEIGVVAARAHHLGFLDLAED